MEMTSHHPNSAVCWNSSILPPFFIIYSLYPPKDNKIHLFIRSSVNSLMLQPLIEIKGIATFKHTFSLQCLIAEKSAS